LLFRQTRAMNGHGRHPVKEKRNEQHDLIGKERIGA
jgi:hypothetical protein